VRRAAACLEQLVAAGVCVEARGEPFRRSVDRGAGKSRCSGHSAVKTPRAADPCHSRVPPPRVLLGHRDAELVEDVSDDSTEGRCRSRLSRMYSTHWVSYLWRRRRRVGSSAIGTPGGAGPCRQVRPALPEDLVGQSGPLPRSFDGRHGLGVDDGQLTFREPSRSEPQASAGRRAPARGGPWHGRCPLSRSSQAAAAPPGLC
jgi:hypothetical protein